MTKSAKIKRNEFQEILSNKLITVSEFSNSIGTSKSWISRLASDNNQYKCSVKFAKRVLKGLGNKYRFDDVFFWVI